MPTTDAVSRAFEAERERLVRVAARLLGSRVEAQDAVQAAWLRLSAVDASGIANLPGWLTTVTSRICLDMLRARRARREAPMRAGAYAVADVRAGSAAERELIHDESIGAAMLVVLQRLPPAERVAFVLHDLFAVPFDEVAEALGRTPAAARQLASRGRRRVRGGPPPPGAADPQHARAVRAFHAAAREGDFEGLLALLAPDVELVTTAATVRGAETVARRAQLGAGRASASGLVQADGRLAVFDAAEGSLKLLMLFTVEHARVARIEVVTDPARLARLTLVLPPDKP